MAAKYLSNSRAGGHPGPADISPPPPTSAAGSRESSASSITSSGSHRNRQLLKSYHDFAMHVFSNNKATQEAERLFLAAVREGDYDRVENFLKRRNHEVVDIDMKDFNSGDTPLIAACRNGFTKVVQLLLKFGADTTLRNYDGETAVSVTASVPIRRLLLDSVERSGCSHRHLLQAAWQGNLTIVQRLLKEGKFLDINCENADGLTPLLLVTRDIMVFEKVKSLLKDYSPDGVVRVLLAQRADPAVSDSEGKTPMHYAAACPSDVGHQITLMLMKDKELMLAQDENCVAPIHVASRHGQVDIVVALLDKGVDVNSRGHAGATPLHVSASAGQMHVADTLLDRGADITLVDDRGNTPMDVAHSKKMRTKLKEAWTEVIQSRRGSTPALSPVKPPSRKDPRRHSSSEETSPRDNEPPMSLTTNRVLQKLKDAHQALLNENQVLRDIDNGRFTPSSLVSTKMNLQNHTNRRSMSPSKAPAPPRTPRGSEEKTNLKSSGQKTHRTLSYDDKTSTPKVKGVKGHQKLGYRHSDPTGNKRFDKAAVPVTVLGLDWDENVQDFRYGRVNQGQLLHQKGSPPTSHSNIPKRLTIDISSNPSLQQVTDICSGYLRRGAKPLPPGEEDSQQFLPEVSPSRPLSGTHRSVFFDGNDINRTTASPFMERLHGFLGTGLPPQSDQSTGRNGNEEQRKTLSVLSVDSPVSPRRTTFTNSPFARLESSQVESCSPQQRTGSLVATTFNIEMSRVNQLKESSDSGQGSSRSTNSRASTISTPSPLLGDVEGSPSRLQGGLKRSLYLQSIDGDSGVQLPSLGKDNVRRVDRIQTLEDRNFRLVNNHQRHNSEDTMSVVSVTSSVTVKTADICGQRISLSHTLKEESEVGSSPEQSLKDHSQMEIQRMKRTMLKEAGEKKESNVGKTEETETDEKGDVDVARPGNVTKDSVIVTSSSPGKSDGLKDSVVLLGEKKGMQTKSDIKNYGEVKQIPATIEGKGPKQEEKLANARDGQTNHKLKTNTSGKEITKLVLSGDRKEGDAHLAGSQQSTQLKKSDVVNDRKKLGQNIMEYLPPEERGIQRCTPKGAKLSQSESIPDHLEKVKTSKETDESSKLNMNANQKIQNLGSNVGKDNLSKDVPDTRKSLETTVNTEKNIQGKENLQKANTKTPSVVKQSEKASSMARQSVKAPSMTKQSEKTSPMTKQSAKIPSPNKQSEKTPSVTKQPENKPSVAKQSEKIPSMIKQSEKVPVVTKRSEKQPSVIKQSENVMTMNKQSEKVLPMTKQSAKIPSFTKQPENIPSVKKQTEKATSIMKQSEKMPFMTKKPEKTIKSEKVKNAKESKGKKNSREVSSLQRNLPDERNTVLRKSEQRIQSQSVGVDETKGKVGSSSSSNHDVLDKSEVKDQRGASQKGEKSENDSSKNGIVTEGRKAPGSDNSKIPQRQRKKDLKQEENTPVNITKKKTSEVSQQNNIPRDKKKPLPTARTTDKKTDSVKVTGVTAESRSIEHTLEVRETSSGKSQGVRSTPTDVTSDLTSDLLSRDSDSIESIEEIVDEVTFLSSSDSEKNEVSTGTDPSKPAPIIHGDYSKQVKPDRTMVDPAVIVTKSVNSSLKNKPSNLSSKSPKTPKKGTSKKFTFKNVENSSAKKNSVKSGQIKRINPSKASSTSDKLKHVQEDIQVKSVDGTKVTAKDINSSGDKKGSSNVKADGKASQHHTPVIIDIRDDIPECPAGNGDNVRESLTVKSPMLKKTQNYPSKKKSTLQQLSQKISKGSLKTSSLVEKASKSVKSVSKNTKTSKVNSIMKETKASKDRSRGQQKGKKLDGKGDVSTTSDSESSTTAFITGQGWEIKTSCNESSGVIIQDGGVHSAEDSLRQKKLSPANSLKIDFLAKRTPMSPEVIKNIANIMSPLESNTPKFIPDTMDTIKEFAGSLSSVEEEKCKAVFTFSPVNSPKISKKQKKGFKTPGKETSPGKSASPLTQDPQTPGSAFLPPPPTEDILSLTSDCKTNPDLLKVFCIPNHFESANSTPRSPLPPDSEKEKTFNASMDKKQIQADGMPKGVKEAIEARRKSVHAIQKQSGSSKFGLSKSLRKSLKRRQSAPAELPSSDEDSSDAESCASSFKNRMRLLADISDVASDDSSADGRASSRQKKNIPGKNRVEETPGEVEENKKKEQREDLPEKNEDKLKSTSKEQLLTDHVQTISIKTLQEFNTILSNSEEVNITSPLAPPPQSSRPISRESLYSRPKTQSSLNQSLPLSEATGGLDMSILDNLKQEGHLCGEFNNTTGRGTTLSSATSGDDRSHSQSTNLSESEGELLHWKKGNILGKGAFGTVFCGLTNTGQLIAVKQVELTGKHQAGEQYEKLQEEVELLKTLRHKNIVGFLGVSLEESVVNIFMQYIPGGSIASLLARFGALEEAVFCRYTHQVVEGTVYLHSNNVIHRDIKGANIMLMSNGVIKLIDFGCAKRLCIEISQSQNLLKSMKGTPYWMAPEVIMETGHGTKSDVWSIGCTVMEMATRKPPWADMPPMSAIFAIGSGGPVPQLADRFSTAARDFVDLCLTRNPDERATSLELLQHPFLKQRKERRKDSRLHSRSSLSNFEDGITFKEQPILKDSSELSRKRIFEDFK